MGCRWPLCGPFASFELMGFLLDGVPRDREYVDDIPMGYAGDGITLGVDESPSESPTERAVWQADLDEMNHIIHDQGYRSESDADHVS